MIKPLNNNVLIKQTNLETKTSSGIILTTSEKVQDNIGTVLSVGQGKMVDGKLQPVCVKEGQKVIYEKYSSHEIEYQNEKYILIEDDKILAVIE